MTTANKREYDRAAICRCANHLVGKGYTRRDAFLQAWALAKAAVVTSVAGVTFGRRQEALARLEKYSPEQVNVELMREPTNQHDSNAIQVVASVEGKGGGYVMGYLPKATAQSLAPIMDGIATVKGVFKAIVGGFGEGISYGMRVALAI